MASSLRAFTLSEVIVSLAFFAIAILALGSVFISSLRLSGQNRQSQQASQIATRFFEELRDTPIHSGSFQGAPATQGFPPTPYPSQELEGVRYRLGVEAIAVAGQPRLYEVLLTVTWGESHRASFAPRAYRP